MRAVRAGECIGDRTGEWFGAFIAKRRPDARQRRCTRRTDVFAGFDRVIAESAERWVKQRDEAIKKTRFGESEHSSTSRSLAPSLRRLR